MNASTRSAIGNGALGRAPGAPGGPEARCMA